MFTSVTDTIKNAIKARLEEKIDEDLAVEDRIPVEIPLSIEDYNLNNPNGAYLIVYKGSSYSKSIAVDFIHQERDAEFTVVLVKRHLAKGRSKDFYIDFCREALTGMSVDNVRADKKVYPVTDEFIKEEKYIWWHGIIFIYPADSIETEEE